MTTQEIIDLINTKGVHAFYISGAWRAKRADVLRRDKDECQRCRRDHKRVRTAVVVHHIKHLRQHPELALDESNLISLCEECHNAEHPEKLKKYASTNRWNDEKW